MSECRIGFFTADAIETSWMSLGIVRDRNGYFYSVEFSPDGQVFSESSRIDSHFELPPIEFIKSRQYAELEDGTFLSPINEKELTSCSAVTATLVNCRVDQPEWTYVEKALNNCLRHSRVAFVNGTIFTTTLITGKAVKLKLEVSLRQPKLFVMTNMTKITYVHAKNAEMVIEYPSFKGPVEMLKKYITYSFFNSEKIPTALDPPPDPNKRNIHPKGCVITGADGSGRGFLVRHVADLLKFKFLEINAENFQSTQVTFPQLNVRIGPKTIVLLRNFDLHIQGNQTPFERRVVNQLATLIDKTSQVFFAMTVVSKDTLPDSIVSCRRLGYSLSIPPLSNADLNTIMGGKFSHRAIDAAVGLQISAIVNATDDNDIFEAVSVANQGSIQGSVAKTSWDDIGGLSETKRIVREAVEWPITRAKDLREFGIKPPRGVLLYGPPGCGKTMIARAIATSLSSSFFSISAASVFQMYLGESERVVRELFALARQKSPAVIFIDEIDAMVGKRGQVTGVSERVLSTFLNEMDGVSSLEDIVVVAATNRKDSLDEALCRPGRFDCLVEVLPSQTISDVEAILKVCVRNMPVSESTIAEVSRLIPLGSSGAEIDNWCREAALCALNSGSDTIEPTHFQSVLSTQRAA